MAKNLSNENFELIISKTLDRTNENFIKCLDRILEKSNENLEKVITLSNRNLEKLLVKSDSNLTKIIELSNENLRKTTVNSETLMSKLFETTVLKMEAISNSFERAVKGMSDAVTDCMNQLHMTMSTLGSTVAQCQ
ncbi:hypothetical protein HELRODRAFT_160096 [Helobdella robusta]|uniref:Uncharacterized protein n=1 Tax=Helobdella robusta TaxID=6412 RepID=T1EPS2_HELRO|nr:hypothetical protein HELRODRAFT_160096 [Helobdella robusta]ESO05992.1 hypothetical protein HELRODRAFT_160096 [Helobdella robusta]